MKYTQHDEREEMEEATQQQRVVQDRMVGFNRVKQHGARLADRCGSTTFFDLSEWWFDSVYGFSLDLSQPEPGRDCGSMQASVSILPVLEGEAMCDLYQRYAGYCGCDRCGGKQLSFVWQREFRSLCPWERAAHL